MSKSVTRPYVYEGLTEDNDAVRLFEFEGVKVRVIRKGDTLWFVAADVCTVLGLESQGVTYRRLSDDEKSYVSRTHVGLSPGRPMVLVSESGLYKLIMRSDKPEARKFQDWVTREVLPSIRKTGSYALKPGQPMPMPSTLAEACRGYAQALLDLAATEDEKAALAAQVDRLTVERDTLSDERLCGILG